MRRPLAGVTMGGALAEALVLSRLAPRWEVALAPQLTAPPPFGVFHDLRWVLVFHPGWWVFAGELLVLWALRTAAVAGLLFLAWPPGPARPSRRELLNGAALYVAGAVVVLADTRLVSRYDLRLGGRRPVLLDSAAIRPFSARFEFTNPDLGCRHHAALAVNAVRSPVRSRKTVPPVRRTEPARRARRPGPNPRCRARPGGTSRWSRPRGPARSRSIR